ncbi:MAG: NAD(P)/FAD-dependent oxidoreductase [Pseudomonadota bacterium]
MSRALNIGIGGAGVAGLAAAALLARLGHRVQVFDQFPEPRPVGSGLMIQPVGLKVLDRLALAENLTAQSSRITRIVGQARNGKRVLDTAYADLRADAVGLAVQRSSLFDLLLQSALDAGTNLVPATTVTGIDDTTLITEDGEIGPFDLVLDCLGAYSPLCPRPSRPLAYGALWALLDWPEGQDFNQGWLEQRYRRAAKMVGVLPVGQRPGAPLKLTFFYSLKGTDYAGWRARSLGAWKTEVLGLWPECGPILDQINTHDDLVFAQYTHHTVRRPGRGRIAHLGDSHHATSPQLGQGANTALLDAAALADALARHDDPTQATAAYARARRGHVWLYQTASWAFTPLYQSDNLFFPWLRNNIAAPISRVPPIPRLLAKLVAGEMIRTGVDRDS